MRLVAGSCPTLWHPMDCGLPDSSVHGILQAIILAWVAMSSSRSSFHPRDQTQGSHIAGRFFYHLSHQQSPWILEWVACSFSRGASQPRKQSGVSCIASSFFTSWTTREALKMNSRINSTVYTFVCLNCRCIVEEEVQISWKKEEWDFVFHL